MDDKAETLRITGSAAMVTLWGITLNDIVAMITIAYLLCQVVVIAPRSWEIVRGWVLAVKARFSNVDPE